MADIIIILDNDGKTIIDTISRETFIKYIKINKNSLKIYAKKIEYPNDNYQVYSMVCEILPHNKHVLTAISKW